MIQIALVNSNSLVKAHYERVCEDSKVKRKGLKSIIHKKVTSLSGLERTFYSQIWNDLDFNNGENLITGDPIYLKNKKDYYESHFATLFTTSFKQNLLKKVFFYSNYDKWEAYKLANDLGVNVCPYCNRQFINTLSGKKFGNTRPQFDHFFDKASYPYLSLSFYNLVPSCSICNSSLKGKNIFCISTNINPYIEAFGSDLMFSIKPCNIQFINGKSSAYRIKYKASPNADLNKIKRALRNVVAFQITRLYNLHKDYVDELIIKSRIYNAEYIESLYNQYQGTLFSDINDVKRMISSNYIDENDFGKRPLSKLISDISTELGLFI